MRTVLRRQDGTETEVDSDSLPPLRPGEKLVMEKDGSATMRLCSNCGRRAVKEET